MAKDKKMVESITARDVDFAQWYTDVVKKAELTGYTSVKGCMVFKPAGYALWENIRNELDRRFKETGVQNVYLFLTRRRSMSRASLPRSHGSRRAVSRSCLRECASVRHPRLCSATCIPRTSSPTEISRRSTTSGVRSFAGRRRLVRSSARENSCGRRATRPTRQPRRLRRALCRC